MCDCQIVDNDDPMAQSEKAEKSEKSKEEKRSQERVAISDEVSGPCEVSATILDTF